MQLRLHHVLLALALCPVFGAAAETPDDLAARLEKLEAAFEARRVELHVPGCSLAVVIDGKVVLARGFGLRDLEQQLPATEETIYAIGSSTKAFTAALGAMLVEDGAVDWDSPVRTWLPDFALKDPEANEKIALRDLLSHRSGLTGTDLLWYGGGASWEEILTCLARAEPVAPFRSAFNYQNVCCLTAGKTMAAASDATWDELLHERILMPLGMNDTTTTIRGLETNEELSLGYVWEPFEEVDRKPGILAPDDEDSARERGGRWTHLPMRNLDAIGPAGSINSNVNDMAQWLRFQLGRGDFDGTRLLADAQFDTMRESHIAISPGVAYGLGWMLRKWDGLDLVEHGGNIDGFGAQVALLPEKNAAMVLLTNLTSTPLQQESIGLVFSALYSSQDGTGEAFPDIENLLGTYHFEVQNSDCTVGFSGGHLTIDVPGQMVFTLTSLGEDGRRKFKGFEFIEIAFVEDDNGDVDHIALFQNGQEFFMWPEGAADEGRLSRTELAPFVGTYRFEQISADATIAQEDGRLVLRVPNEPAWTLSPPDDEGWRSFRAMANFEVRFDHDESGGVVSTTIRQPAGTFVLNRTSPPAEAHPLASVDEVNALVRAKCNAGAYPTSLSNVRMKGSVNLVNQGIVGDVDVIFAGYDRFRQRVDMEPFGWVLQVVSGDEGWSRSSFLPPEYLVNKELEAVQLLHPALLLREWPAWFQQAEVIGREPVVAAEGEEPPVDTEAWVVSLGRRHLPAMTVKIGVDSGRVRQVSMPLPGGAGRAETRYEDWRAIEGVWFSFRQVSTQPGMGKVVVQFETAEHNLQFDWEPFVIRD